MVEKFWNANTNEAWRHDFVQEWQITHIYIGKYEREIMRGEVTPPGELVYDQDGVMIYEVSP